jgi:hypothetical protein
MNGAQAAVMRLVVWGSAFEVFPEGVGEFGAKLVRHASRSALDFFDELVEIAARAGDGNNAKGGGLPGYCLVHFGDGNVEALAKLVLHGADYLAAILEGLSVFDAEFKGEVGYGHGVARPLRFGQRRDSLGRTLRSASL